MPNSKQKVRDRDYYGEYQKKSCYTVEQWQKIITNEAFVSPTELAILKEIFSSANHAASILQLAFRHKKDPSYFFDKMNQLASNIGRPNGYSVDVDLNGNEYWWYLLFWGKNTKLAGLEWKLLPELAEAIEYTYPELEDQYNSYMSEIERSEQIDYTKEDSVWIASTLLLFEKVYLEHPTDIYDLLLMQYEVSQRSQKIYGQDVDVDIITDNCNADSSRCVFPYLRDIDKYWRVCYPGEIEDAVLRPAKIDYNAYVPSKFGFVKLKELCEFLETDYSKLTDPNYIEIDESNPFYKMIRFIRENGRRRYMDLTAPTEEDIERFLRQKEDGKEALNAFHTIGSLLTSQYPSFVQTEQASWLERDNTTIKNCWIDSYELKEYKGMGPTFATLCGQNEEQKGKIVFSVLLQFPIESPDITDQVMNKCGNLTVLTSANFKVEKSIRMDSLYGSAFGNSVIAHVTFEEQDVLDDSLQDVMIKFETAIQILASYFLDICESVYAPQMITEKPVSNIHENVDSEKTASIVTTTTDSSSAQSASAIAAAVSIQKRCVPVSNHSDRTDCSFQLYPKNLFIQGISESGQMELAIRYAVGIMEGIEEAQILQESYEDITARYHSYCDNGRILFSGDACLTYEDWMESAYGDGRFTTFAKQAGEGRYVCIIQNMDSFMLKEMMKDACYLMDANKREGQMEYQTVQLLPSMESFSIPSNLHFIGIGSSLRFPDMQDGIMTDFHVKYTDIDYNDLKEIKIDDIELYPLISKLNQRITYLAGPDHQIGHKLFAPLKTSPTLEALGSIFHSQVVPNLLSSFTDGFMENPWKNLHMVFGDFKKSKPEYQFIKKEVLNSSDLFGNAMESETKEIYSVQRDAFYQKESYLELL